jgi:hypothetical protein
VTDRVEADRMSIGAAWLWCLAGCLGAWYVALWSVLQFVLHYAFELQVSGAPVAAFLLRDYYRGKAYCSRMHDPRGRAARCGKSSSARAP